MPFSVTPSSVSDTKCAALGHAALWRAKPVRSNAFEAGDRNGGLSPGRRRQNRVVVSIGFGTLQKLYLSHEHTIPRATDGSINIVRD